MDKKSVWKAIGTIKDPMVRAYLENAVLTGLVNLPKRR